MAFSGSWYIFSNQFWKHIRHFKRNISCSKAMNEMAIAMLTNRGHIHVKGNDSVKFLQGLLTNDVALFHSDNQMNAMYSMMLNSKGRVLYDLLLYKYDNGFLMESDAMAVASILKTFQLYKLRSHVTFKDVSKHFDTYAVLKENATYGSIRTGKEKHGIFVVDPRVALLGSRLLLPRGDDVTDYFYDVVKINNQEVYDEHRVKLGVCEGIKDIKPHHALPLEYNVTEMHGVSFHKGCYIGQELTARTYHTGMIRKRLLPFQMENALLTENMLPNENVTLTSMNGKQAGKVISTYDKYGFGLMRVDVVKSHPKFLLSLNDGRKLEVYVNWPVWLREK